MIWHDLSNLVKYYDTRIYRVGESILGAETRLEDRMKLDPYVEL